MQANRMLCLTMAAMVTVLQGCGFNLNRPEAVATDVVMLSGKVSTSAEMMTMTYQGKQIIATPNSFVAETDSGWMSGTVVAEEMTSHGIFLTLQMGDGATYSAELTPTNEADTLTYRLINKSTGEIEFQGPITARGGVKVTQLESKVKQTTGDRQAYLVVDDLSIGGVVVGASTAGIGIAAIGMLSLTIIFGVAYGGITGLTGPYDCDGWFDRWWNGCV